MPHVQAQETAKPAADAVQNNIWILDSPVEWPAMIRPGIIGGNSRTVYYSDFLIPAIGTENTLLFINPKLNWDDHDSNEQNIGIGLRHILFNDSLILGANLYYDFMKSYYDNRFEQWGFGVEALSKWIDIRGNFYFPQSSKQVIDQDAYYAFASRSLQKTTTSTYEEPMKGIDYEAGVLIPYISNYVETRAFIGGYNYFSDLGPDINGIKARLEIMPLPLLTIDVKISDDNTSSTRTCVGGYVTLPFSIGNMFDNKNPFEGLHKFVSFGKGARPLVNRMTDMVIRDTDVLLNDITPSPVVTDEISGLTYVDNSNTSGIEDGSFEHPYKTIQQGVNNTIGDKWVYVRQGSAEYSEDISLNDDVVLWGSGYDGGFTGIAATAYPVIDGGSLPGDANLVTIRNNNTVMGLQLQNSPQSGIIFTDGTTSRGTINNNIIKDSGYNGINLSNNTGSISGFTISNNSITGSNWRGIDLSYNSGSMQNFNILNNVACDSQGGGGITDNVGGIIGVENTGTMSGFTISGNTANGYMGGTGISFYKNKGKMSGFVISDNTCNLNTDGISLASNARPGGVAEMNDFTISGNTLNSNGFCGLTLLGNGSEGDGDMTNFTISGNTINNNQMTGIELSSNGDQGFGKMTDFVLSGNTVSNNGVRGIDLSYNGGNPFSTGNRGIMTNFTFSGNTVTGNGYGSSSAYGGDGIRIHQNGWRGEGIMTGFTFSNNVISDNRSNGIRISDNGYRGIGTIENFTFTHNTISNNHIDGITITNNGDRDGIGTIDSFTFTHNTIIGNYQNGMHFDNASGGTISGINLGDATSGGYNSIYANNISLGAYYDIDNLTVTNISAQYNWWGTTDSQTIEANINSKDNITYTPYLYSEP